MSRIAKKPIIIPDGVDVNVTGNSVNVKGKLGELKKDFPTVISINKEEKNISVKPVGKGSEEELISKHSATIGLVWKLISNMVEGVSEGFSRKLLIEGVGYRASVQGNKLTLQVGYSNDRILDIPEGLKVEAPEAKRGETPTLVVSGADKEQVGAFAAYIKKQRPVEPYKGKGIRYDGEYVRRKEGKAASK